MSKSEIQNQLQYVIANEQYLKPLLNAGKISVEVYNEVLENLYDECELWKYGRMKNPRVEFNKKTREPKQTMANQKPGYISLTELAKGCSDSQAGYIIHSWLRDENTVNFLALWEKKHNEKFVDLIPGKRMTLTPKIWIDRTNSIGIVSRQGRGGGTYAHKEIAMHFMCWISAEMMLKIIEKYVEVISDEESN
ncbi:MAG: KilA-N domain-containing protein [Clostridia bacterium]|nr:KilA-N domain-containing protein [Clostridia bacterium]